jgi:metal-dependent amidase/aminoacylase/carboxypeptidase family protein
MCVRGLTAEAMMAANRKVNAALRAGAEALGAQVEITEFGAYLPFVQNEEMNLLFAENAIELVGPEHVVDMRDQITASSTDAGDFATLKPTIHPCYGGASGAVHTKSFDVVDEYNAYVLASKAIALTVIDLLYDNSQKGIAIKDSFKPLFANKEEYVKFFSEHLGI